MGYCFTETRSHSIQTVEHPEDHICIHILHRYPVNIHKCIMTYKCRNGLGPQYLCDLFNSNNSMHSHNTQNSSQLRATKSHTSKGSNQILWNYNASRRTIPKVQTRYFETTMLVGIVLLELSKKVLLCQVLKVHYLSLLLRYLCLPSFK